MKRAFAIIGILTVLIGGWLLYAQRLMPSVESVIATFHEQYNNQNFRYIYEEMTSKEFKAALPYKPYAEFMERVYNEIGRVAQARKGKWGLFYENVGLVFNIEYYTENEKGKTKEYFRLLKRGSKWAVLLYDIKEKTSNFN